jgi:fucose 4-O-acetylase-like acetyltransferase
VAVAAASPVVANLPWGNTPAIVQEYLAAGPGRGRFAFFPCAAYVGFGLASGAIVRRAPAERFDRLMQWAVLIGVCLVFSGQYFSNIPYSVYRKSSFWTDSPALIFIRLGLALLGLAGAYLWTAYGARSGWSWVQTLGRHSLMVYWVHVMLVYGDILKPLKRALSVAEAALATVIVVSLMLALCPAATYISQYSRRPRAGRIAA